MDLGIKGRRAIVTGGSSGIGFETARQLLEEGVRVLITGRNKDKLDKAQDDLARRTAGEVHAVVADMTREADIATMVETAKQKLGGVDILVNNAGHVRQRHDQFGAAQPDQVAGDRVRRRQRAGQRHLPGLGGDRPLGAQYRRHEEGIRRCQRGRDAQGGGEEKFARRMGKPGELANATAFLCSERASYITGVALNLDGGRLKGLW